MNLNIVTNTTNSFAVVSQSAPLRARLSCFRALALLLSLLGVVPLAFGPAAQANSVQEIIDDMNLNSEGTPHGVPSNYSWYSGSVGRYNYNNQNAPYMRPWFHVYEPTDGNPSSSARVQLRNLQLYIMYEDNVWHRSTLQQDFGGAAYTEAYNGPSKSGDKQGNAVRSGCQSSAGCGYNFHGWSDSRWAQEARPIRGIFSTFEARLINDSSGKYLASAGFDYVREDWSIVDGGQGRLKWVTPNWRSFNYCSMSDDDIRYKTPPINAGPPIGDTIALRSPQAGYYVSTDLNNPEGGLYPLRAAWATSPGTWERYRVDDAGNGQIALYSLNNNYYVSADNSRGDKVLRAAWSTSPGDWEKFSWDSQGGNTIGLRSNATGKYVSADLNSSQENRLKALWADSVGSWEQFEYSLQCLTGTYFDNADFTGPSYTRRDNQIDYNWGSGSPMPNLIGPDTFSVRWTGYIVPRYTQAYTFFVNSDDGVRLWINGQQIINSWTNTAGERQSTTLNLTAGQIVPIRLEYYDNSGGAKCQLYWQSTSQAKQIVPDECTMPDDSQATPLGTGSGLKGQYYSGQNFSTLIQNRLDPQINFNWGTGAAMSSVGPDSFSVRWTGTVQAQEGGLYTFRTTTDDGVRLWLNSQQVIDNWTSSAGSYTATITLSPAQAIALRMDYFENNGNANAKLKWKRPGQTSFVIVPKTQLYPAP